jgi:hypothetical protein
MIRHLLFALILVAASACELKEEIGSQLDASTADTSTDGRDGSASPDVVAAGPDATPSTPDAGAADSGTGNVEVYVVGDLTPKSFPDAGVSGQTPNPNVMGLARFDLMLSSTDPTPAKVLDLGAQWIPVDMLGRTLAGVASSDAIPPATYTWGRVLLTMSRFTVDAQIHQGAYSVPGKLTVTTALSDTTIDGTAWPKGKAVYDVTAAGNHSSASGTLPPLPSTAGGMTVEENGHTWLVFPVSPPFVIAQGDKTLHKVDIVYDVYQSFRWQELPTPGFTLGAFDIDAAGTFEPVVNFGATGYRFVVE